MFVKNNFFEINWFDVEIEYIVFLLENWELNLFFRGWWIKFIFGK